MALSLMLRSANRFSGQCCMFKSTPIAFNAVGRYHILINKQHESRTLPNIVITTPALRCMSGDHRFMWTLERVFAVSLVGVLPLTIAMPNPVLDNIAAIMVVLHFHWGLEAMSLDYVRPIIFGTVISKMSHAAVYIISAITLGGIMYFNYTDIGVGKAIRKIWAIKSS